MTESNCLAVLGETLSLAHRQISGNNNSSRRQSFTLEQFWNAYVTTSKHISLEATKLCMAVVTPPVPTEADIRLMSNRLETASLALITAFCGLPREEGETLYRIVRCSILEILKSLQDFCVEASNNRSLAQVQSIGNVWEKCNSVLTLPKSNREAVLQRVSDQLSTVSDALVELQQNMDNENRMNEFDDLSNQEPDEQWSDADRQLLPSCKALVRASKAVLKKTAGMLESLESLEDHATLDRLATEVSPISATVDDFVLSCYAPMQHNVVRINASTLSEILKRTLNLIRYAEFNVNSLDWVEFLLRAVDHNLAKIVDLALED